MAKLAAVELELHKALHDYIETEEVKLKELRDFAEGIATARKLKDNAVAMKDYAANPIRGYLMLKRFVRQWMSMKEKMEENEGITFRFVD